ncbi:protein of unknown function [Nitrospira japonica]|uniref:Uncharacterized protein n=1 Tax=Nitrospira japonica TaxID=1325564 RepID=A0A1W1I132_9BACT|nr:protein of unknown function [Nitrospira japonica]
MPSSIGSESPYDHSLAIKKSWQDQYQFIRILRRMEKFIKLSSFMRNQP